MEPLLLVCGGCGVKIRAADPERARARHCPRCATPLAPAVAEAAPDRTSTAAWRRTQIGPGDRSTRCRPRRCGFSPAILGVDHPAPAPVALGPGRGGCLAGRVVVRSASPASCPVGDRPGSDAGLVELAAPPVPGTIPIPIPAPGPATGRTSPARSSPGPIASRWPRRRASSLTEIEADPEAR